MGKTGNKFTMLGRAKKNTKDNSPGPGTYEPKTSINTTGQYMVSNMHSALAPSFSMPSMK